MNDGLVNRRPSCAKAGEFGVDAVALQHINRRHCLAALLIGDRPLDDRPVDAAGGALIGLIGNVLETPIDDQFECIELLFGRFSGRLSISALLSTSQPFNGRSSTPGALARTPRFPGICPARRRASGALLSRSGPRQLSLWGRRLAGGPVPWPNARRAPRYAVVVARWCPGGRFSPAPAFADEDRVGPCFARCPVARRASPGPLSRDGTVVRSWPSLCGPSVGSAAGERSRWWPARCRLSPWLPTRRRY